MPTSSESQPAAVTAPEVDENTVDELAAADTPNVGDDVDPRAGERIAWAPQTLVPLGIVALGMGVNGAYELHWGDGASTDTASGAGSVRHTYERPGAYMLAIRQSDLVVATAQVYVRDGLTPAITFAAAADNPNIIEGTIQADPPDLVSNYEITWAPGEVETVLAAKGTVVRHGYPAGTHTIGCRDLHTGRSGSTQVTVTDRQFDPDFGVVAVAGQPMTAEVTLSRVTASKSILVDWGDGVQVSIPSPAVGTKVTHPYTNADSYIIQTVYSDGSGEGAARIFTATSPLTPVDGQPDSDTPDSDAPDTPQGQDEADSDTSEPEAEEAEPDAGESTEDSQS